LTSEVGRAYDRGLQVSKRKKNFIDEIIGKGRGGKSYFVFGGEKRWERLFLSVKLIEE